MSTKCFTWISAILIFIPISNCHQYSQHKELVCFHNLNNGQQICDCHYDKKAMVLQDLTGSYDKIIIQNCHSLFVQPDTFQAVSYIGNMHFRHITNLVLQSNWMNLQGITFQNITFEEIASHSIKGNIDSVNFADCHIGRLKAYAIYSKSKCDITFENTVVHTIESQTLKKFKAGRLVLRNSRFLTDIPSKTFSDLEVTDQVIIARCNFSTIYSFAFELSDVNDFIFADNQVDQLNGEAFAINVNGRILIERNKFGRFSQSALSGIRVGNRNKNIQKEIYFSSNVISTMDFPVQINTDHNFALRIADLRFSQQIDCDKANKLESNYLLKQNDEAIYFNFGSNEYISLAKIVSRNCATKSYILAILAVSGLFIVIFAIVVVAFSYRFLVKQKAERNLNVVMPDGKTYRETQIIFQVEHAGLLKTNL